MRGARLGLPIVSGFVACLVGCAERPLTVLPPCVRGESAVPIGPRSARGDLDLLLVMESSATVGAHQQELVAELPRLFDILTHGDLDLDGTLEFVPFGSLHVGVVTTDLGSGPIEGVPTCERGLGDGGVMRSRSSGGSGCLASYPSNVFDFHAGSGEPVSALANEVGCVAAVGTTGCGFEQPLEAALRALSPRHASTSHAAGYEPARFSDENGVPDSVPGNADGPNAGFARPSSVLAVWVLTDEDDCSVRDFGLFDPTDARFADDPLDVRCPRFSSDPVVEHAIERYVDGLAGLRVEPSLVVFGAIVGVPPELAPVRDVAAALADARSRQTENEAGDRRAPSCIGPRGGGHAPVRLLEAARGLDAAGVRVSVASICASLAPAVDDFAAAVARTAPFGCLPRALPSRAEGLRDCELYELSAPGVSCDEARGRTLEEVLTDHDDASRVLCRVPQVTAGDAGPGWFYDDGPDALDLCGASPRLAFTEGAGPMAGSELRMACADVVLDDEVRHDPWCDHDNGRVFPCQVGMICEVEADRCPTGGLVCDRLHGLCAIPCASDDDCRVRDATLVCDLRVLDDDRPRGICLHPTCGP